MTSTYIVDRKRKKCRKEDVVRAVYPWQVLMTFRSLPYEMDVVLDEQHVLDDKSFLTIFRPFL